MRGKGKIGRQVFFLFYLDQSKNNLNGQNQKKRVDKNDQQKTLGKMGIK